MVLDAPDDGRGPWFLIVPRAGDVPPVAVEWRADRGFGVSTPGPDDYGAGVDEIYASVKSASRRIQQLVRTGAPAEPPPPVRLATLRESRGLSQGELAERAGVGQPNISRIEGRGDFKVSTLARVAAALGGSLSIRVRFPDGVDRELELGAVVAASPPPGGRPGAAFIARRRPRRPRRPAEAHPATG